MFILTVKCALTFWWGVMMGVLLGLYSKLALTATYSSVGWFGIICTIFAAPLGVWMLWQKELRPVFGFLKRLGHELRRDYQGRQFYKKEFNKDQCNCTNESH